MGLSEVGQDTTIEADEEPMAIGSLFDEDEASGAASSAPAAAAVSDASSDALSFWDSGEAAVVAMPIQFIALIDVIKAISTSCVVVQQLQLCFSQLHNMHTHPCSLEVKCSKCPKAGHEQLLFTSFPNDAFCAEGIQPMWTPGL